MTIMKNLNHFALTAVVFLAFFPIFLTAAEEKKSDETAPSVQRGFSSLSPEELAVGGLLLFDGRTLFGWEATPLKTERRASVPDPKIVLKEGTMRIETEIPIRLKTRLYLAQPWRIELAVLTAPGTKARAEIHEMSNLYLKRFVFPFPETGLDRSEPITITAVKENEVENAVSEGEVKEEDGRGLAIIIEKGTVILEKVKFFPGSRPLLTGSNLSGWKTLGDVRVEPSNDEGRDALRLTGGSGSLESEESFDDFFLSLDFKENATPNNSGLFFRSIPGSKMDGYEAQMNNNPPEADRTKFLGNDTGSIFRRAAARRLVTEPTAWNRLTVMAEADFFRTWVNGVPALVWTDTRPADDNPRKGRRFKRGTIQIQGHDPTTDLLLRDLRITDGKGDGFLPTSVQKEGNPAEEKTTDSKDGLSPENRAFEAFRPFYEKYRASGKSITDYHIHLRGSMTPEKAIQREKETGIKSGVLENAGRDWPLSDDAKIDAMVDAVKAASPNLPVGLQVNDRDWFTAISPKTLKRLDFILADTMIMGEGPDGKPQKLWLLPKDYDADPEEWMERYMAHNLQILDEPISILANPTYLPEFVADRYDQLWTDDRMAQIIEKAVEKGVALEIQAGSPFPSERFIKMALDKGATFSFGTNNFDATLKNLDRWREVLEKHDVKKTKN